MPPSRSNSPVTPRFTPRGLAFFCCLAAILTSGGCLERTLTIRTDPPGALIYLNDQEFGRTPVTRDFEWYGDYQIDVRKDGYQSINTHRWVVAPWFEWIPFDLFTELLPMRVKDHHTLHFKLTPSTNAITNPMDLISRGNALKNKLESGEFTRSPSSRPATQPATRSTTRPQTQPATPTIQPTTSAE